MNGKNRSKQLMKIIFVISIAGLALILSACASSNSTSDEESGVELTLDETYDHVRNGVRLVLAHDPDSNSFKGFVENTRESTLKRVRVEVHLSNGVELGPTIPVDLTPGERHDVKLSAKNLEFDSWTAHPEVGESSSEHGQGEGKNEHGEDGEGEHSGGSD